MRIFASLMTVPPEKLAETVGRLDACVDGFHIDIMDGIFVVGAAVGDKGASGLPGRDRVAQVKGMTHKPLWVHLMVAYPRPYLDSFLAEPDDKDIVSVHYEAYSSDVDLADDLRTVRNKGMQAGIVVSPSTPVEALRVYHDRCDHITVMGVVPGKSGQAMLPDTRCRVQALMQLREELCGTFRIGLDGGVSVTTLRQFSGCLPDDIAAATSIVGAADPCRAVAELRGTV